MNISRRSPETFGLNTKTHGQKQARNRTLGNHQSKYLIGIDLGTTHSALSWVDLAEIEKDISPKVFYIDQLVGAGEIGRKPLLPSFVYLCHGTEVSDSDTQLPWHSTLPPDSTIRTKTSKTKTIVGEWARDLGAKTRGRLVSSAKSWLCHTLVDREEKILPWSSELDDEEKLSPVEATSLYLDHIKNSWNYHHPEALLENQLVVVTIPASFDEMARKLTLDAAARAGLPDIMLLEEPQAVFYDWLLRNRDAIRQRLQHTRVVLVVDIGGGTTDFSLIKVTGSDIDDSRIERIGVGDHLMLGGDNIDLALAHQVEKKLNAPSARLKSSALSQLIQQTRIAKEQFLSGFEGEEIPVSILAGGSKLIGKTIKSAVHKNEVRSIVLEGFLKSVEYGESPDKTRSGSGIIEFGLPYATDANFLKHISEFLSRHQVACQAAQSSQAENNLSPGARKSSIPDTVLFNGGVFNSSVIKNRLLDTLSAWRGEPVIELDNPQPDLAVTKGAVAYGLAIKGYLKKISGGSARSYYLLLENEETAENNEADGQEARQNAICILPKGTEEGVDQHLKQITFALKLGSPVKFLIASSTSDTSHEVGEIVPRSDDFITLPPLITVLNLTDENPGSGAMEEPAEEQVQLHCSLSSIGTITIFCTSKQGRKWQIEFDTRQQKPTNTKSSGEVSGQTGTDDRLPAKYPEAIEKLSLVFNKNRKAKDPKRVKSLRADLEKLLGKRDQWSLHLSRKLFQELLDRKKYRHSSALHERLWFNLAGYTLRPGTGTELDSWFIDQVWPLFNQGLKHSQENQSWAEWWIFWRRIAAGLNEQQQTAVCNSVINYLNPSVLRSRKMSAEIKTRSYEDMVQLVASLENLPIEKKMQCSQYLFARLENHKKEPSITWWGLGRIGARIPFYGTLNKIIAADIVEKWLGLYLTVDWKSNQHCAFGATMIARMADNRDFDISRAMREKVIKKLRNDKCPASWVAMVESRMELNDRESKRIFGESLPSGLKLISF